MIQKLKVVQLVSYNLITGMPYTVNTFWTNKLAPVANTKHCYYRLADVAQIPNVPGIYSWHLWIDTNNTTKYSQVFKHKRIKINVESNLSDVFKGHIDHVGHDTDIFNPVIDLTVCNLASIAMCPPLYIGISKDLGQRLTNHKDELDKILKGIIPTPVDTISKRKFDTIWESQHFAQRMGFVISKLNNHNAQNLLIKTLEMPSTYPWSDLQKVEAFLNRTYFPIYGRK